VSVRSRDPVPTTSAAVALRASTATNQTLSTEEELIREDAAPTDLTRQRAFGRKGVFSYINATNADLYQRVMRLFYENKRVLGSRLNESEVKNRLQREFAWEVDDDQLVSALESLVDWGALDAQHDSGRARSLKEWRQKRHNYAITQQGEVCERALQELDGLRERIGALEGSRLQAILEELARIENELALDLPDGESLSRSLDHLRAELEALDQGVTDFMAQLANVRASAEAISDESFIAYKSRVVEYLGGFAAEFGRTSGRIEEAILRIEAQGVERMIALAAANDEPPVFGKTAEEVAEIRRAEKRDSWRALHAWFSAPEGTPAPWRKLAEALGDAIEWVIQTAGRLDSHRRARVDRSAEYRHLAKLASTFDDASCHALFNAVFALGAPRHFFGIAEDPAEAERPTARWVQAPPAPVETHLYRPGGRTGGSGTGAGVVDTTERKRLYAEQCKREREQLTRALEKFPAATAVTLADLSELNEYEFAYLLEWLDRALCQRRGADGVLRAHSSDGTLQLLLYPPATSEERAAVRTVRGRLDCPNYRLEVRPE
jgi:uncharacterized protein (TIGR02677 family)